MAIVKTNFYTQDLNQFAPHRLRGEYLDWGLNAEVIEVKIDASQGDTPVYAGDALTIVATSTGKLKVKAAGAGDPIFGFALFNPKHTSYKPGDIVSCLCDGGVVSMVTEATVKAGATVAYAAADGSVATVAQGGSPIGIAMAAVTATEGGTLIPVLVQKPALVAPAA